MKIKKISATIIILLVLINVSQFLWYVNPIGFFGPPRVPDEETAIAIARDFDENLRGQRRNDGSVFVAEYIEGSGRWLVRESLPRGGLCGGSGFYIFAVRARDGRVVELRIPH